MLVLRRKVGQSLKISDNIKITIVSIREDGVQIAVEAPKHIPVLRSELLYAMDANRDAAQEAVGPEKLMELLSGLRGPQDAGAGQR